MCGEFGLTQLVINDDRQVVDRHRWRSRRGRLDLSSLIQTPTHRQGQSQGATTGLGSEEHPPPWQKGLFWEQDSLQWKSRLAYGKTLTQVTEGVEWLVDNVTASICRPPPNLREFDDTTMISTTNLEELKRIIRDMSHMLTLKEWRDTRMASHGSQNSKFYQIQNPVLCLAMCACPKNNLRIIIWIIKTP